QAARTSTEASGPRTVTVGFIRLREARILCNHSTKFHRMMVHSVCGTTVASGAARPGASSPSAQIIGASEDPGQRRARERLAARGRPAARVVTAVGVVGERHLQRQREAVETLPSPVGRGGEVLPLGVVVLVAVLALEVVVDRDEAILEEIF